jgi:small-conductance mechanosensitive channel
VTLIQFPAVPDTLADLHLPRAFEHWRDAYLVDFTQKLIVFVLLASVLYAAARVTRRLIGRQIEDVNRRHALRKSVGYAYAVLLLLLAVALFADSLAGFGTVLAVILAGVAIALQDVLKSVVGWLYVSSRTGVQVGSRVEVEGVKGDVIDIGVLKTTMLEVGNLVFGQQSTGRIVTVPNSRMIAANVFVSAADNPFVWQEVQFVLTFESDWERAEEILARLGAELHSEIEGEVVPGYQRLQKRYAFRAGALTPIVYVSHNERGVELTLRFLTNVRRRRGSVDRITRGFLQAIAGEPAIRMAYPPVRLYRGDEAPSGEGPPGHLV